MNHPLFKKRFFPKSSWVFFFLGLLSLPFQGYTQKFFVNLYNTSHGLPSNQVRQVVQDENGYLWIATDAGLVHFDGQTFTDQSRGFSSLYIRTILPARDGRYLFSSDAGVMQIAGSRGEYRFPTLIPGEVTTGDSTLLYPNCLFGDRQGRLWISQPNAVVARWDNGNLQFYTFPETTASGSSDSGFSFGEDRFGTLWAVSVTGHLFAFDPDKDEFELKEQFTPVYDLKVEGDTLWLAGEGLWWLQVNDQQETCQEKRFDTGGRVISCMARAPEGFWYAGTKQNGLYRALPRGEELTWQEVFGSNDPHRVDRLPLRHINDIFISEDGGLWLSTDEGLGLLKTRFFEAANGVAFNNTTIVAAINKRLYASFGHVYEIERRGGEFYGRLLPGLEHGSVNGMAATSRHFWMSTTSGELFAYENGKISHLIDLTGRGGGIFSLLADRNDNLWFCQAPTQTPILGLAKIAPDLSVKTYGDHAGLGDRMLIVKESDRGVIYAAGIGEDTYLYRYDPEADRFINLSLPLNFPHSTTFEVHDLAIDQLGVIWLATTDGLLRFDLERVQRIDLGDRFTRGEMRAVVAMDDGSLWVATDAYGLLYYRDGHHVLVDESSGLPSKVAAYRCLVRDGDGYLWVGTAEGVVHSFVPNPRPGQSVQPALLDVRVNDRVRPEGEGPLMLPHHPDVALQFHSMAFPGEGTQYQYRLMGQADSSWSVPSERNELLLSRLDPGAYQLEVRARQPGGYDWSESLVRRLFVKKAWYATPWGLALLVVGGGLGLWLLVRLRLSRLRRQVHSLEEEVRSKESQLQQQSEAADSLKRQLARPISNLEILHAVIHSLPQDADLDTLLKTLASAIRPPVDVAAFEVAYYQHDELHFRGFSWRAESFTRRAGEFNEKTDLAAWAMAGRETLLIRDFRVEHGLYIEPVSDYQYASMIFSPFELRKGKRLVFCLYHFRKSAFDEHDVMAVQLLTDYLARILRWRDGG